MKYTIKPRGIIKWRPFAALSDTGNDLYELDAKNNAKVMPELSPEQMAEYNRDLCIAIANADDIFISWWEDGVFKTTSGTITKIDQIEKVIFINQEKIAINTIIEVV